MKGSTSSILSMIALSLPAAAALANMLPAVLQLNMLPAAHAGSMLGPAPIAVGNATQLMVDDTIVETMSPQLERSFHTPSFDTVVVQAEHLPLAPLSLIHISEPTRPY